MSDGKLAFVSDELAQLRAQGLYVDIRTISSPQGAWLTVDGQLALNFCSNNYLGLANDPKLKAAAKRAIDDLGVGPAAVRSIAGTNNLHIELERRLAAFKGAPATISFQSGFCANLATIPALVGPGDVIFSDALNHASLIDASRLSGARIVRYNHCEVADLKRLIAAEGKFRRGVIVTDAVFSMDGDIAPLPDIAAIAEREGLLLLVDDAHGEGVLGRGGRGAVDHFGLHGKVDVEVGTLSKAFGVVGGYVAGDPAVVDLLHQRGRPFLFSSAVTPSDVAACIAAVDQLEASTERVERLWNNARYFRDEARRLGFDTGQSQTPIIPILLGEAPVAKEFSKRLFLAGVFAMSIGFPTVPRGQARIRVILSAAHSREDLDRGLETFQSVGRELGVL